eukprot:SM000042S15333  [mRNA]  locus=s42:389387:392619:+ [translate_table: standard]
MLAAPLRTPTQTAATAAPAATRAVTATEAPAAAAEHGGAVALSPIAAGGCPGWPPRPPRRPDSRFVIRCETSDACQRCAAGAPEPCEEHSTAASTRRLHHGKSALTMQLEVLKSQLVVEDSADEAAITSKVADLTIPGGSEDDECNIEVGSSSRARRRRKKAKAPFSGPANTTLSHDIGGNKGKKCSEALSGTSTGVLVLPKSASERCLAVECEQSFQHNQTLPEDSPSRLLVRSSSLPVNIEVQLAHSTWPKPPGLESPSPHSGIGSISHFNRSHTLPAPLRLRSAMRGGRKSAGLAMPTREEFRVRWAPDVTEPKQSTVSHTLGQGGRGKGRSSGATHTRRRAEGGKNRQTKGLKHDKKGHKHGEAAKKRDPNRDADERSWLSLISSRALSILTKDVNGKEPAGQAMSSPPSSSPSPSLTSDDSCSPSPVNMSGVSSMLPGEWMLPDELAEQEDEGAEIVQDIGSWSHVTRRGRRARLDASVQVDKNSAVKVCGLAEVKDCDSGQAHSASCIAPGMSSISAGKSLQSALASGAAKHCAQSPALAEQGRWQQVAEDDVYLLLQAKELLHSTSRTALVIQAPQSVEFFVGGVPEAQNQDMYKVAVDTKILADCTAQVIG